MRRGERSASTTTAPQPQPPPYPSSQQEHLPRVLTPYCNLPVEPQHLFAASPDAKHAPTPPTSLCPACCRRHSLHQTSEAPDASQTLFWRYRNLEILFVTSRRQPARFARLKPHLFSYNYENIDNARDFRAARSGARDFLFNTSAVHLTGYLDAPAAHSAAAIFFLMFWRPRTRLRRAAPPQNLSSRYGTPVTPADSPRRARGAEGRPALFCALCDDFVTLRRKHICSSSAATLNSLTRPRRGALAWAFLLRVSNYHTDPCPLVTRLRRVVDFFWSHDLPLLISVHQRAQRRRRPFNSKCRVPPTRPPSTAFPPTRRLRDVFFRPLESLRTPSCTTITSRRGHGAQRRPEFFFDILTPAYSSTNHQRLPTRSAAARAFLLKLWTSRELYHLRPPSPDA
ncbi:hypothetical protein C8J57DRAFT_1504475 [Mycena rebaudengoi]|nr:hypothetical protein C8J57DRAFT_1504475 [Mycena rebaudengoi]